ncbi:MAG: hypothetical protein AAGF12_40485 [Myxococcota bacterium]
MSLISTGTPCKVCGRKLGDERFLFTGRVFDAERRPHPEFDSVVVHWDCLAEWSRREELGAAVLASKAMLADKRHSPIALETGRVLVVAFARGDRIQMEIVVGATGQSERLMLSEWESWLEAGAACFGREIHSVQVAALDELLPEVRRALPNRASVEQAIDPPAMFRRHAELVAAMEADRAAQQASRRAEVEAMNAVTRQVAAQLETTGIACPHCATVSRDHRHVKPKNADREDYFVCVACKSSFAPHDVNT